MKKLLAVCVVSLVCGSAGVVFAENAAEIGDIRLKGYLGERLDQMIERHLVATDVDYITAPFLEKTERKNWWQTEFWGKWMHAAVPFLRYSGSDRLRASVERGVDRILASQEPCGYIGNYPDELRCGEGWDVWGMKYSLMGLLHYYDLVSWEVEKRGGGGQRKEEVLNAAKRLCDYVIGEIGPGGKRGRELWQTGNWSGYASSSILEPVVWLYRRTKEEKYLDFATYVVKGMSEPASGPRLVDLALKGVPVADRNGYGNAEAEKDGRYVSKHNRWKSYEMMSCYQGLLDYFEVKSESEKGRSAEFGNLYLAALKTAENIAQDEINLAGGCSSSEAWYKGATKQHLPYYRLQETCVTTTWMRLCEKLLEVTDDPRWADELEKTFYNAYLAALKADGSWFASYTPLTGSRSPGQHHCFMHTNCCNANGPRGFLCFLKELFRTRGEAMTVNFYASALVKGVIPATGKRVAFDMYSLYPRVHATRLVSHTEKAGTVPLRLRIPSWSAKTSVRLNGKELSGVRAGTYFTIAHDWQLGDVVEIAFDMPVVSHLCGGHVAFTRGPVLLARDVRFADGDLAEPFSFRSIGDGQLQPTFAPVRTPSDDIWMAFSATLPIGQHFENPEGRNPMTVFFCDYASAGNAWRRGNYYRTWMLVEYGPSDR